MKTLEVRCCCDARLLGYAEVPDDKVILGARIVVPKITSDVEAYFSASEPALAHTEYYAFRICLIDVIIENDDKSLEVVSMLAIKSNDYPKETVERLPGFRKPTQEQLAGDLK